MEANSRVVGAGFETADVARLISDPRIPEDRRSTFINLAEAGGTLPEDVHRLTHASIGEAKDLYRRIPQQWPRLCRAVRCIQITTSGEVLQSVSRSYSERTSETGIPVLSPWVTETPENGRARESNPPAAPFSTTHRF